MATGNRMRTIPASTPLLHQLSPSHRDHIVSRAWPVVVVVACAACVADGRDPSSRGAATSDAVRGVAGSSDSEIDGEKTLHADVQRDRPDDMAAVERVVSPDVRDEIARHGKARVVVSLALPESFDALAADLSSLRVQVSRVQQAVLSGVSPGEFRVVQRFEAVPALSGWLFEAGVETLASKPGVVRIDLDTGGQGSGSGDSRPSSDP